MRFEALPTARIEVRSDRDTVAEVRWEESWPSARTVYAHRYLTTVGTLSVASGELSGEIAYDGRSGQAQFDLTFDADTEVTGYMKLKLWVEARATDPGDPVPDDLIVCCFIDKLDRSGRPVRFYGTAGQDQDAVSRGYGRAKRRALDHAKSSIYHPVLRNDLDQPLQPGEVVPLEIAFCPSATHFHAGETLRLIIAARDRSQK